MYNDVNQKTEIQILFPFFYMHVFKLYDTVL